MNKQLHYFTAISSNTQQSVKRYHCRLLEQINWLSTEPIKNFVTMEMENVFALLRNKNCQFTLMRALVDPRQYFSAELDF
jgi:hypothetical protein